MISKEQNCFQVSTIQPIYSISRQNASTSSANITKEEGSEEEDPPVIFTKSKAFKAKPTFVNPNYENRPPFQNTSIFISLSSLMIYFFYLREENDMDELLGESLYNRIDGLEKANLIASIRYTDIT